MEVSSGLFVSGAYHRRRVSPRSPSWRASPRSSPASSSCGPTVRATASAGCSPRRPRSASPRRVALAAGPARYVRISGRIDAEDEFEDDAHRPLVFRRTRLQVRRDDRWVDLRGRPPARPVRGPRRPGRDRRRRCRPRRRARRRAARIGRHRRRRRRPRPGRDCVHHPGPAAGRAGLLGRARHRASACRDSTRRASRGSRPGLGRPLVLTTLERDEAMRVLAEGERRRPLVAAGLPRRRPRPDRGRARPGRDRRRVVRRRAPAHRRAGRRGRRLAPDRSDRPGRVAQPGPGGRRSAERRAGARPGRRPAASPCWRSSRSVCCRCWRPSSYVRLTARRAGLRPVRRSRTFVLLARTVRLLGSCHQLHISSDGIVPTSLPPDQPMPRCRSPRPLGCLASIRTRSGPGVTPAGCATTGSTRAATDATGWAISSASWRRPRPAPSTASPPRRPARGAAAGRSIPRPPPGSPAAGGARRCRRRPTRSTPSGTLDLTILATVARSINASDDPDEALDAVVRAVRDAYGHHLVAVWEAQGDHLTPRAVAGAELGAMTGPSVSSMSRCEPACSVGRWLSPPAGTGRSRGPLSAILLGDDPGDRRARGRAGRTARAGGGDPG